MPCEGVEYKIQESYAKFPGAHLIDVYNNSYFIQSGVIPIPDWAVINHTYPNGTVVYYWSTLIDRQLITANYIKLVIYYDALEYLQVNEELQYTLFRFIADYTGLLSIFIGAGFLSFFEILELIYSIFKPSNSARMSL